MNWIYDTDLIQAISGLFKLDMTCFYPTQRQFDHGRSILPSATLRYSNFRYFGLYSYIYIFSLNELLFYQKKKKKSIWLWIWPIILCHV